jgi:S-DNA-T family DNA segregation ATPase FtsK/SpoIIIE
MKNNVKINTAAGVILFALAAVFSISLLLVLFDFGGMSPAHNTYLYQVGKMFAGVYGICSALIPVFLFVSAVMCFTTKWRTRTGVILLGSVIPFFTLDALEHICRMLAKENDGDIFIMKLVAAVLTGVIIVAVEYLLLAILGEAIENHQGESEDSDDEAIVEEESASDEYYGSDSVNNSYMPDEPDNFDSNEGYLKEERTEIPENPVKYTPLKRFNIKDLEVPVEYEEKNDVEFTDETIAHDEVPSGADVSQYAEQVENPIKTLQAEDPTIITEESAVKVSDSAESPVEDTKAIVNEESPDQGGAVTADGDANEEPSPFDHIFDAQERRYEEETYETPDPSEDVPDHGWSATVDNDGSEASVEVSETGGFANEEVPDPDHGWSATGDDDGSEASVGESKTGCFAIEDDSIGITDDADIPYNEYDEDETQSVKDFFSDDGDGSIDDAEILDDEIEEDDTDSEWADAADDANETEISDQGGAATTEGDGSEASTVDFANVDFGDATISSEIDGQEGDDLSDFVEKRNSSFDKIFSQMSEDAAQNPVVSEEDGFDDDLDSLFDEENPNEELSGVTEEERQFDPTAEPVVDANGVAYGTSVPFNTEDISFEDVAKARKNINSVKNANKSAVLNDSADIAEKLAPVEQLAEEEIQLEKPVEKPVEKQKPRLKMSDYKIPTEILTTYENGEYWVVDEATRAAAEDLKETLKEFNIEAEVTGIRKGPVVTMFEILPAPGVKLSKIVALQDNIALRLAASSVRIVAPIPGKHAVGIEVPNADRSVVSFKEIVEEANPAFDKMAIPVILGKDISGEPQIIDLAKTPHLLIAGSTGAGKSVCVNSMILSILYKRSPNQVKLILIDPKIVELKLYNDIPHLLTPVITEPKRALQALQYCLCEMERRYALLDGMGVRDITSYNRRITERKVMQEKLPYIVIIIDEFADLMATTGKELESNVARLAAMSRAVGIHLVLATQRPSVNVITGLIKANIPSRIAFMVASRTDSNIIIDSVGAEKLLGKGDMLYTSATDPYPTRIQGTLVSDDEVEKVVDYVKQYGEPDYIDDEIFVDDDEEGEGSGPGLFSDGEDPLYDQALQIVVQAGKASASYIQRRLKIGYNRAARLVEEMEERGIVGPANGSKPREVIYVP